jgi:hypothetical protein
MQNRTGAGRANGAFTLPTPASSGIPNSFGDTDNRLHVRDHTFGFALISVLGSGKKVPGLCTALDDGCHP